MIKALTCLRCISHYCDDLSLCGSFNGFIPNLCNATRNGDGEFVAVGRAGIILGDRADHVFAQFGIKFNLGFFQELGIRPIQSHLTYSAEFGTVGKEYVFTNVMALLATDSNIHVTRGVDNDHSIQRVNAFCQVGEVVGFGNIQASIFQNHNAAVCANAGNTAVGIGFGRADRNGSVSRNGNAIA